MDAALFYDAGTVADRFDALSIGATWRATSASACGSTARSPRRCGSRSPRAAKGFGSFCRERGILMRDCSTSRSVVARSCTARAAAVVAAGVPSAAGRRFYDDDPLPREPDSQDASKVAAVGHRSARRSRDQPVCHARATRRRTCAPATSTPSTRSRTRTGSPTASARGRSPSTRRPTARWRIRGPAPGRWTRDRAQAAGLRAGLHDARLDRRRCGSCRSTPTAIPKPPPARCWSPTRSSGRSATGRSRTTSIAVRRDQLDIADDGDVHAAVRQDAADAAERPGRRVRARASRRRRQLSRRRGARRCRASRSAASATTARVPTIPTTSCRTSIGASCAR